LDQQYGTAHQEFFITARGSDAADAGGEATARTQGCFGFVTQGVIPFSPTVRIDSGRFSHASKIASLLQESSQIDLPPWW
jgi:hypothetical protein